MYRLAGDLTRAIANLFDLLENSYIYILLTFSFVERFAASKNHFCVWG
jgi:hypothetical protein